DESGMKKSATMQIVKVETIAGQTRARFEVTQMGKKLEHVGEISTSDKGVFLHKIEPPLCLLKYPVTEGQTWRAKSTINGVGFLTICTVGKWEQVEVPAGKFKAIKVRVEYEENAAPFSMEHWFAADVGLVMSKVSGTKTILKLEKFEKANDRK